LRDWLRIGLAILTLGGLVFAALIALGQLNAWRHNRALAKAEVWNQTEWESGSAFEVTLAISTRLSDVSRRQENKITCFRKSLVSSSFGLMPKFESNIVNRSLFYDFAFTVVTENRKISGLRTQKLCDELLHNGIPDLPKPLSGALLIKEIPIGADPTIFIDGQTVQLPTFPKECQINWASNAPLSIEGGVLIDPVVITKIEPVPLQDVLASSADMGPASEARERLRNDISGRRALAPTYQWNNGQLCWVRSNDGTCDSDADDICGIPKL